MSAPFAAELPPLPAPTAEAWGNSQDPRFDAYTAEQMRQYALLAFPSGLTSAAIAVLEERQRQDEKWGGADHDDTLAFAQWVQLIQDYAGWARVMFGMDSPDKARRRLIQVAALAVAAAESLDRTTTQENP